MKLTCNICNKDNFKKVLRINKPDRFEKSMGISENNYSRTWHECLNCDILYNNIPSKVLKKIASLRDSYYEIDLSGEPLISKYKKIMSLPSDYSDNAQRVQRIKNFFVDWIGDKKKQKILDIGSGLGVFLAKWIENMSSKWDCYALEPDPIAAEHLRSLNKFTVVQKTYSSSKDLVNFRVVTINKVLEHMDNPLNFLKAVKTSLDIKKSFIYIEVPDKFTIKHRPSTDNILGSLHCNLYSPKSLLYVLENSGFEILKIDRILEPSGKLTIFAFAAIKKILDKEEFRNEQKSN